MTADPLRRFVFVHYTRDDVEPLSDDDPEMSSGWRCVPVPPTPDGGWVIWDDTPDRKTGWIRAFHPRGRA